MRKHNGDNQPDFHFRTLNYLGSKLRLLDFIMDNVRCVTPDGAGVCDLFAGSGCVAYRMSSSFPVTACDIQQYSMTICDALLGNSKIPAIPVENLIASSRRSPIKELESIFRPLIDIENRAIEDKNITVLADIVDFGSLEAYRAGRMKSSVSDAQRIVLKAIDSSGLSPRDTFISRHYGGVYFSYRQAVAIDMLLSTIRQIDSAPERTVLLASLMSTASDIVDTVGKHFAQPIKTRDRKGKLKTLVYSKAVKDKTIDVEDVYKAWVAAYSTLPRGPFHNKTICGDYAKCLVSLPENVSTVYADPPYTRDHYSRFYHVLETIAIGDEPVISTVKIHGSTHLSNGLYRADRHQSPFCIKSKGPDAFDSLFRLTASRGCNLLLSYSPYDETKKTHPRVVTMSQLRTWAGKYFRNVDLVSAGHFVHNKLNSIEHKLESSGEAEMLIVCTGAR